MRKKTIAILFGIGFGLSIVSIIVMFGGIAALGNAAAQCNYSSTYCDPSAGMGGYIALLVFGGLVALAGSVLSTISWVAIMVKQAQRQQWGWFVCTILLGSIPMLLWLILEPEVPAAPQYVAVYQPGYPPAYPTDGPPPTSYPPSYQDPYRPQ